jgi:hypothetical protein
MHVPDAVDEDRVRELTELSQDQNSDAMRAGRAALDEYVEIATAEGAGARSAVPGVAGPPTGAGRAGSAGRVSRAGLLGAIGGGAVLAGAVLGEAVPVLAADSNVAILQTAASIENLAVSTYSKALGLPYVGGSGANPVVRTFVTTTRDQHAAHAKAFNAAVAKLGGKQQTGPDPKYNTVVQQALPKVKGPGDVVSLALSLEDVAAQTYVKDTSMVTTPALRQLFASVAGVEAQHRAILLSIQALLPTPNLITSPPPIAQLPATVGDAGFPNAFYPTAMASPANEGALS